MGREAMRANWEASFAEQTARHAYNTAPVEAIVRLVAYYLRDRCPDPAARTGLHFLELGCGAGPNLAWLADQGVRVSGLDIAPTALELSRRTLERFGVLDRLGELREGSVTATPFPDASFDGIIEACVFQHLDRAERAAAFGEVRRLLRPGGLFVGYLLDRGHTVYQTRRKDELADDPGSLVLRDGRSAIHLTDIGLTHFFAREELIGLLSGFASVDPCLTTYSLPAEEARRRGHAEYVQSMWAVHAIR